MAKAPKAPENEKIDRRKTGAELDSAVGRAVAPKDAEPSADNELKHPDDEANDDDVTDEAPEPRAARADRSNAGGKRFYKGTQEVDHDLFKLDIARMKKNVSFTDVPDYQMIEHCHMFHSVDSRGRKQDASSNVGGHFHEVREIGVSKDGVPKLEISPAMRHVWKKVKGRKVKVAMLISELEEDGDTHTHKAIYIRSEKIRLQMATHPEFARLEATIAQREVRGGIPGIVAG